MYTYLSDSAFCTGYRVVYSVWAGTGWDIPSFDIDYEIKLRIFQVHCKYCIMECSENNVQILNSLMCTYYLHIQTWHCTNYTGTVVYVVWFSILLPCVRCVLPDGVWAVATCRKACKHCFCLYMYMWCFSRTDLTLMRDCALQRGLRLTATCTCACACACACTRE